MQSPQIPDTLRKSRHLSAFAHMGDVYLFHDLFGFILKMSADVLAFLDEFAAPAAHAELAARYADAFEGQTAAQFVEVFFQFHCLVDPEAEEIAEIWNYYPVKAAWTVWERGDDDSITLYTAWGERPLRKVVLSPEDARLWQSFDGETPLSNKLDDNYQPSAVERLVTRLVHHDVQALKLSVAPISLYKGRPNLVPPYLTSTMPYPPFEPGVDSAPLPLTGEISPASYYRDQVEDADAQFDHQETTLSHLLRRPHPVLNGRTYGQALVDALAGRDLLPNGAVRVLEVGAGLGYVTRAVIEALQSRGLDVEYHIVELSPALAAAQRERCAGLPVTIREGDILEISVEEARYDLFLANEMIGDLPVVQLTHREAGIGAADEAARHRALDKLGDVGKLVRELEVQLGDAPDPFYLTTGALELLKRAWAALAPGGTAFISEFGEPGRWPRLSTHLDHPEFSIHFGVYTDAARTLGFTADTHFIIDLFEFDRTLEGMASTRSYFRALAALLAEHGIQLEKIGYTREMFDELIAGSLDPTRFGDITFDQLEARLMGLVPHEFKALVAQRPR